MTAASRDEVTAFLYREARMMDAHDYDGWLELWTQDAHYWIPSHDDEVAPLRNVAIVNEDRHGLNDRIARLKSGAAYAQDPRTRLTRSVSNIEIGEPDGDEMDAICVFLIATWRKQRTETVGGRSFYRLRGNGADLRIVRKKVLLVASDGVMNNLTYLI